MKIDDDFTLSEILEEIHDSSISVASKSVPISNDYSIMSRKLAVKNYMKNITPQTKQRMIDTNCQGKVLSKSEEIIIGNKCNNLKNIEEKDVLELSDTKTQLEHTITSRLYNAPKQVNNNLTVENSTQNINVDNTDMTQIEFEHQETSDNSTNWTDITNHFQTDFIIEWENFSNETNDIDLDFLLDKTNIPLVEADDKKVIFFG